MSTLAERFAAAVDVAVELDATAHHPDGLPAAIWTAIITADEPHDGLRAATYEARVRSSRGDSHPERLMLDGVHAGSTPERWKREDTHAVSRSGLAFIDAVSAINAARDVGTPGDWNEALADAHLMSEMHAGEFIAAAIDLAYDRGPYHALIRAVDALAAIARRWDVARVASTEDRLRAKKHCRSCERAGVPSAHQRTRVSAMCCQRCWRDVKDLEGFVRDDNDEIIPAVELQLDPRYWPSEELVRAKEDQRPAHVIARAWDSWLRSLDIDPETVHSARRAKRHA